MNEKPITLQEAILLIESLNKKNSDLQTSFDSESATNVKLRTQLTESQNEIFGLKTALEAEQKSVGLLKTKVSELETSNKKISEDMASLRTKFDELSKKDMDIESRASAKAAQITGASGVEKPIENAAEVDESSIEEIAEKISKASGKEKALLMNKYGDKVSAYLKSKKL